MLSKRCRTRSIKVKDRILRDIYEKFKKERGENREVGGLGEGFKVFFRKDYEKRLFDVFIWGVILVTVVLRG